MRMRGLCGALLWLLLACGEPKPPNVLVYVVDTLRADELGCYGGDETLTPHIDRFAREGILFEHAFATSSWTRPSMASILTGLHPAHHGVTTRDAHLSPEDPSLASLLSEEGYGTGFVTTNPNVGSFYGFSRGFEDVVELYERREPGGIQEHELVARSPRVTQYALDWIRLARRPFLLVTLTTDPHSPYRPPPAFDRYGGDYRGSVGPGYMTSRQLRSQADRERARSLYRGEIAFNDDSFGKLIDALRENGVLDETLVIFTADHGEEFWEREGRVGHGESLADSLLHVPLIVRPPVSNRVARGSRVSRPVELVDLLPTILAAVDASPAPPGLDGRSLFAEAPPDPRPIFASLSLDDRDSHAVRRHPWKLVWHRDSQVVELLDLRRPKAGERPASTPAERRVARELHHVLRDHLSDERTPTEGANELPTDVEEGLRALGYIE